MRQCTWKRYNDTDYVAEGVRVRNVFKGVKYGICKRINCVPSCFSRIRRCSSQQNLTSQIKAIQSAIPTFQIKSSQVQSHPGALSFIFNVKENVRTYQAALGVALIHQAI